MVFQLNVRVVLPPTASPPVTVCVPIVTPAVASVRTRSKLAVTFFPPTFCTATTTATVLPCPTPTGALTPVTARSVDGTGFTSMPIAMLLFAELLSASFCVANRVCPVTADPAVFQGISTVVVAPMARPATVCVPSVGPAHPSVRTTSKLALTSTSPTFWTVTTTCAVSPWITERGPVMPGSAISVGLGFTVATVLI